MTSDTGPEAYTRREVAALFGVTPRTVQQWARTGLIRCFRTPGGQYRFNGTAIRDLLARRTQERTSAGL